MQMLVLQIVTLASETTSDTDRKVFKHFQDAIIYGLYMVPPNPPPPFSYYLLSLSD